MRFLRIPGLVLVAFCTTGCAGPHSTVGNGLARPSPTMNPQTTYARGLEAEAAASDLDHRRKALVYYQLAAGPRTLDIFAPGSVAQRASIRRVAVAQDQTRWAARAAATRMEIEADGALGSLKRACDNARAIISSPVVNEQIDRLRLVWAAACNQ